MEEELDAAIAEVNRLRGDRRLALCLYCGLVERAANLYRCHTQSHRYDMKYFCRDCSTECATCGKRYGKGFGQEHRMMELHGPIDQ